MNDTITWVNSMGFGDCFWHCQYLTKLGGSHILHCREHHHQDLKELFPSVEYRGMNNIPENAIDCWIGASCEYSWHSALCERDLVRFLGETWFEGLSRRVGVSNPIRNREDMLYDCPFTQIQKCRGVFFVNAVPRSGQVSNFTEDARNALNDLVPFKMLNCTNDRIDSRPMAGMRSHSRRSLSFEAIAGVATGPLWPCLSKQNAGKPFYILLDQVFLNYGPAHMIHHFSTVSDMAAKLREDGWI